MGDLAHLIADELDRRRHVLGRRRARVRQASHFLRHHGEAPAVLARPGRLDGRVERQQVGLRRDLLDQVDEVGDGLGEAAQLLHLSRRGAYHFLHVEQRLSGGRDVGLVPSRQVLDPPAQVAHPGGGLGIGLGDLPEAHLDAAASDRLLHGQPVTMAGASAPRYRAYAADGRFIGLCQLDAQGRLAPKRLIAA